MASSTDSGLTLQRAMRIRATPSRVLSAFFEPRDLEAWWEVYRSVTVARPLGPYAVQWPATDSEDDVLGRLGGTLYGTVMDFRPSSSFFVADLHYQPPQGAPLGPMALEVQVRGIEDGRTTELVVRQSTEDDGERWQRYFLIMGSGWDRALDALREHLEWSGVRPVQPRVWEMS